MLVVKHWDLFFRYKFNTITLHNYKRAKLRAFSNDWGFVTLASMNLFRRSFLAKRQLSSSTLVSWMKLEGSIFKHFGSWILNICEFLGDCDAKAQNPANQFTNCMTLIDVNAWYMCCGFYFFCQAIVDNCEGPQIRSHLSKL